MLLRPSTDICPKDLTRDVRGFFNSLLSLVCDVLVKTPKWSADKPDLLFW